MPSWSGLKRSACWHSHAQSRLAISRASASQHKRRWLSTAQGEAHNEQQPAHLTDNEFLDFVLDASELKSGLQENVAPTRHIIGRQAAAPTGGRTRRARKRAAHQVRHQIAGSPNRLSVVSSDKDVNDNPPKPRRRPTLVGYLKRRPGEELNGNPANPRWERLRWIAIQNQARPSADVSGAWNRNWARLNVKYDTDIKYDAKDALDVDLDGRAEEWAQTLLASIEERKPYEVGILRISDFQKRFGERSRGVWREVVLWLLAHRKDRVVDFLLATHIGPYYAPMNWVADSLYHLALHYSSTDSPDQVDHIRRLVTAFLILTDRPITSEKMEMNTGFFRRVIPFCTSSEVSEMYRAIKLKKVEVRAYTLHHISRFFAQNDHLEQGIDALLEARSLGSMVNSYAFRSNCTTLLRHAVRHPAGQRIGLRLVDNLLGMGVYLDQQLRGVMMLNAVDSDDMDTALAIYRSIIEHGIVPDAQTYGILLKGCRKNLSNTELLTNIVDEAITKTDVRKNPILATQILHCLCLHHIQNEAKFSTIAEVYAQLFDKSPLEKLGIDMRTQHETPEQVEKPLMPSSYEFLIMISAYLTEAPVAEAKRIYGVWRDLVRRGEHPFASLASTPFLANAILYKLVSEKDSLLHAAQVVKDMQDDLPPSAGVQQIEPDIYTWSILVHGFARHRQTKQASRVVAKMQELGIEPNQVTWWSLLKGFAYEQDVDGTLDTLRALEEANIVYEDWVYRGLSRLDERSRTRLKSEMKRRRMLQNLDFVSDVKEDLTRKIADLGISEQEVVEEAVPQPA